MKYVYRVEFILSFAYDIDGGAKNDYTTIVKKIVAEDHRDVMSKIDKLFKTWLDDPKTHVFGLFFHATSEDPHFVDLVVSNTTLKLDITKLERGTQIDIE
jgi:hypothetical protein